MFEALRMMHGQAVDQNEKRAQSAIRWDKQGVKNQARVGRYMVFSQLPDDVFDDIKEAVITGKRKWK